jgi:hypothetical protein
MLGKGMGQRVNLVANNGKYYIDTANRSNGKNDFQAGHTYFVYLLYAKSNTKVTFQIYVGKNADDVADSVKMVRVGTQRTDGIVIAAPFEFSEQPASTWQWDKADYKDGILTVTMDLSKFATDFTKGEQEACKPSSVCTWNGTACGCAAATAKDIDYQCEDAVCRWSSKAMECPSGGCIGFQFTLPKTFSADGNNYRPSPEPFPSSWIFDWHQFLVDKETAGSCYYSDNPPDPR